MKTKQLGIWMDHSNAHLMAITSDELETKIIDSKLTDEVQKESLTKSEKTLHNSQDADLSAYYKAIAAEIVQYEEVLLFGPTSAKVELLNILKADHHFDKIDIQTKQADKMTVNQQHAFVKEYFFKH